MPRRRPQPRSSRPQPPLPAQRRIEQGPDGYDYEVRAVSAARAVKTYRCPGCDQELKPGIAHVVVWPADVGDSAAEERRHWHAPCWTKGRSPTRRWS